MRKIKPIKIEEKEMSLEAPREMYPHFSISLEHLPEAKNWKVGNKYYIFLELKQTDMSIHDRDEETHGHVGFEIKGIEVAKEKRNYKELPDIE